MRFKLQFLWFKPLIWLLLLPGLAMAGGQQTAQSKAGIRTISQSRLNDFRSQNDFNYYRKLNPKQNWFDQMWDSFWQKVYDFLSSTSYEHFWKYVLYAIIIVVLVVAVLQLAKIDFAGFFMKSKTAAKPISFSDAPENIHEIDFDAEIEQAVAQKQYRLAVRLYYLKSLKSLSDRDLIKWESDKTNRSYLKELRPGQLRQQFDQLTLFFELAWYGEVPVDEAYFNKIREKFTLFGTVLQQAA